MSLTLRCSVSGSRPSLSGGRAQQRCGNEPGHLQTERSHLEHANVAIDGKAVRATSKEAQPVHPLSASDVKTGGVLFQVTIQDKQNEISALKPLLIPICIHKLIRSQSQARGY